MGVGRELFIWYVSVLWDWNIRKLSKIRTWAKSDALQRFMDFKKVFFPSLCFRFALL